MFLYKLTLFVILVVLTTCQFLEPNNEESLYINELLKTCKFLRTSTRPVMNYSEPVHVEVHFQMIKFDGIDDKMELFSTTGFLIVQWQLPECANKTGDPKWRGIWRIRPSDYSGTTGQSMPFWYPVIWQPNGAGNVFHRLILLLRIIL